jgi:hypothetical protein
MSLPPNVLRARSCKRLWSPEIGVGHGTVGVGHGPVRGGAWSNGVGHGPVDKAPGCCKVALGSNPRPSTPKMGSSKVDEQPTGGPTKIRG